MEQSELGKKWLTELLEILGYPAVINVADEIDNLRSGCSLIIDHSNFRPHQIQALIGTDGVMIDAIQHLANNSLNANLPSESRGFFYVVELNDYRKQRQAALEKIGNEAIAFVTTNQQNYEIKNLSAAERRQVHIFFEDYPHIETCSEGKEPNRYLIVSLAKTNPDPITLI